MDEYLVPTQIPTECIRVGLARQGEQPSYRAIYNAILDGKIEAEKVNGRYRVRRSRLPEIAALFGLSAQPSEAA